MLRSSVCQIKIVKEIRVINLKTSTIFLFGIGRKTRDMDKSASCTVFKFLKHVEPKIQ